jgi:transposase-like protein
MITITVHCPHCGSEDLVRNGRAPNGKQNYRCRACVAGKVVNIRPRMPTQKNVGKRE